MCKVCFTDNFQLEDLFSITCNFSGQNKLSTVPIQIILSNNKNYSTLYLIKMKLVDRFSLQTISELHFLFHSPTWLY